MVGRVGLLAQNALPGHAHTFPGALILPVGPTSGEALAGGEQAVGHFKWPESGSEETRFFFFSFFQERDLVAVGIV